jgi:hypothetical protein
MNYSITSTQELSQSADILALELLTQDFSKKVVDKISPELHPRLTIRVDSMKGNDIILSYTLEEWNYFVYIITKGNDLLAMAKRLFDKLLSLFTSCLF